MFSYVFSRHTYISSRTSYLHIYNMQIHSTYSSSYTVDVMCLDPTLTT